MRTRAPGRRPKPAVRPSRRSDRRNGPIAVSRLRDRAVSKPTSEEDGRGGFRTCDPSRVKQGVSHAVGLERPANTSKAELQRTSRPDSFGPIRLRSAQRLAQRAWAARRDGGRALRDLARAGSRPAPLLRVAVGALKSPRLGRMIAGPLASSGAPVTAHVFRRAGPHGLAAIRSSRLRRTARAARA
jgi:hypothetical protein